MSPFLVLKIAPPMVSIGSPISKVVSTPASEETSLAIALRLTGLFLSLIKDFTLSAIESN